MKRLIAAAIILSLVSASAAIADEHRDHGDDRGGWAQHRDSDHRGGEERGDFRQGEWGRGQRAGHDQHEWREQRAWRDGDRQDHDRWQQRREWQDRDHGWYEGRFPDRDDQSRLGLSRT